MDDCNIENKSNRETQEITNVRDELINAIKKHDTTTIAELMSKHDQNQV